ncbi:hypothetical protein [Paraferrimonas sp. SM1919]|uniref:hypothetical protein n=1 Tax=Paraferrimonas sp. SM1919 TaxID=2662263 RepID=UPI0013D8515D|nr:hypothetical protein [Paraferrimonas sp. SM1919]
MTKHFNSKIPLWVNLFQALLIAIMFGQAYVFYFDHQAIVDSGISIGSSSADLNLLYEFAARTATMAIVSLIVLLSQNPRYFVVILLMNLFREGQETIIDPLFPLLNAPMSPSGDFVAHLVIVAIELWAFITVLKIVRAQDKTN